MDEYIDGDLEDNVYHLYKGSGEEVSSGWTFSGKCTPFSTRSLGGGWGEDRGHLKTLVVPRKTREVTNGKEC